MGDLRYPQPDETAAHASPVVVMAPGASAHPPWFGRRAHRRALAAAGRAARRAVARSRAWRLGRTTQEH
jgi:hypothetical protein